MCDIESILLTYENKNRLEFQYCAEFFRLIGVYVCENLRNEEDDSGEIICEKNIFARCYNVEEKTDDVRWSDYLEKVLTKIVGEDCLEGWLGDVVSLYDRMQLMQASVVLQYYYKTEQEKLILEAGKQFKDAANGFISIEQKYQEALDSRHFLYAKLYCKEKANFARYYYNKSYEYHIEKLVEDGVEIIKRFRDFSNIWVLLGLIYESSDKYFRESEDAFLQAASMLGYVPHAASVHYWLGRLYERNVFPMSAEASYRKANELVVRYRNEYKIAMFEYNHDKWTDALNNFDRCLNLLDRKEKYLDPLEIEYYFKVCMQMSITYMKLHDYRNVIIKAMTALRLRDDIINEWNGYTEFYNDVFQKNNARKYIDLTISKMNPKNAYQYLAEACEKLGLKEDAEQYRDLYRACI